MSEEVIVLLILFVVFIGGYFVIMYFFPEWVGISGEVTKKNEESHGPAEKDVSKE